METTRCSGGVSLECSRARIPHGRAGLYIVYAGVYTERRMRRICRLDLLPYRSEIVLAVVAGPQSLPSPEEKQGGKGTRRTKGWRGCGGGKSGREDCTLPHTKKRPSTKTFNFRSPSASSIQDVCESTGPGHESRHSAASHPFPIPLASPQTYGYGARR